MTSPAREKLRLVRHVRTAFDGRFFERRPDFWPIEAAARLFADHADWPSPAELDPAFTELRAAPLPVRFEEAPMKRKRPPGPIDRAGLYDAMIVHRRVVSTRPRMWHDYLNALVWATFPQAKLALHRRQNAAIERWIPPGATHLPNARTRELDALALVDEGGILMLDVKGAPPRRIVFGHALFEGMVFEQTAMISRAVVLDGRSGPAPALVAETLALADARLAALLDDTAQVTAPEELTRLPLDPAP